MSTSGGHLTLIWRGSTLCFKARITFSIPAQPAAAFKWPMLLLMLPTAICSFEQPTSLVLNTFCKAVNSILSPTGVPVPWPSTKVAVFGSSLALFQARLMASSWPLIVGEYIPGHLPSLLDATPRSTAWILSPSRSASARRFITNITLPSPINMPFVSLSYDVTLGLVLKTGVLENAMYMPMEQSVQVAPAIIVSQSP